MDALAPRTAIILAACPGGSSEKDCKREMEEQAESFGALLRRHRLTMGLSQEALAERAGLSLRGIADLERGVRRAPYRHTVSQLADALGLADGPRAALVAAAGPRVRTSPPAVPGRAGTSPELPAPLTSFVGREQDVVEVDRLLGATRLLTLVGTGGVGKTRLALEVARRARAAYPDGCALVELAQLTDPALLPEAVLAGLGISGPTRRPREAVIRALRSSRMLLLLDNCEHLAPACAELADSLLRACPSLCILATSRQRLDVPGEVAWRVPSLSIPTSARGSSLLELQQHDAVRLFVARAATAAPGFTLTDEHADAIAQVCQRLDGIPLAVELAAAWTRVLAPGQIAARLDDRFRLLVGGSRTAPVRQQTLRAALEWSYDQLSADEQLLFDHLSVFVGSWTLEAAEAVGGLESTLVLGVLAGLVDKSLVLADPADPAEARFRLLETLRQYGRERLLERGQTELVRRRHARFFGALAERTAPWLRGPEQRVWLRRLGQDHDNFRAALGWAIEGGESALGLSLAAALVEFWRRRGDIGEGQAWLERALERPGAAPPETVAAALYGAGHLAYFLGTGKRGAAFTFLSRSLELRRQLGDARGTAESLRGLARVLTTHDGDPARAEALFAESLSLFQALGDAWGIAECLSGMGNLAHAQGDLARAERLMADGLALSRAQQDAWQTKYALQALGHLVWEMGDLERAGALVKEALTLAGELGDQMGIAICLQSLALMAVGQGSYERAARLFGAAARLRAACGLPPFGRSWMRTDEGVDAARAALGRAGFAAGSAAGAALALDEVIAEALAG